LQLECLTLKQSSKRARIGSSTASAPRLDAASGGENTASHPRFQSEPEGLDWANFFIADIQAGFGTFVAFYLASLGWSEAKVGFALAVDGVAAVLALIPGGALTDAVSGKRGLAALGVLMICTAAVLLASAPTTVLVYVAQMLHGLTAGILGPALTAISLGLVGRSAMAARTGRNFRFSAAGTALTATVLGTVGSVVAPYAIFLAAAALCAPALAALGSIRKEENRLCAIAQCGTG
jgi:MFS family permease